MPVRRVARVAPDVVHVSTGRVRLATTQMDTLRLRLLKVAAYVSSSVRRVLVRLPTTFPLASIFMGPMVITQPASLSINRTAMRDKAPTGPFSGYTPQRSDQKSPREMGRATWRNSHTSTNADTHSDLKVWPHLGNRDLTFPVGCGIRDVDYAICTHHGLAGEVCRNSWIDPADGTRTDSSSSSACSRRRSCARSLDTLGRVLR